MKKAALIILDGWGFSETPDCSAVDRANTPVVDGLLSSCPNSRLITHGEEVGLPEGQMGNSEVGHLNIGAGRVVYQDLVKINKAIKEGKIDEDKKLRNSVEKTVARGGNVHLLGLCSEGGVHSHIDHLFGICDYIDGFIEKEYYVHAITDGRDTDPQSGAGNIRQIVEKCKDSRAHLATVVGRYYAMDRDRRWERTKVAWDALVNRIGEKTKDPVSRIKASYRDGVTDEFLRPCMVVDRDGGEAPPVRGSDLVFFFNFRTDRPRQLCQALTQRAFPDYGMRPLDLKLLTMTIYDPQFKGVEVLFEKDNISETLGEVVSESGLSQLRIAETEKYPHVTFFFSGGREEKFPGEDRILIPSPKVATYDLKPEMSAREVTDALMEYLESKTPDFICLNYANPDMVGHTGVMEAAIKAVETVDECLGKLVPYCKSKNYELIIIADHGNSDCLINPDGTPNTAHTINPVPCIYTGQNNPNIGLRDGILADVAPTIIELMGLKQPGAMTGRSLLTHKDQ